MSLFLDQIYMSFILRNSAFIQNESILRLYSSTNFFYFEGKKDTLQGINNSGKKSVKKQKNVVKNRSGSRERERKRRVIFSW